MKVRGLVKHSFQIKETEATNLFLFRNKISKDSDQLEKDHLIFNKGVTT